MFCPAALPAALLFSLTVAPLGAQSPEARSSAREIRRLRESSNAAIARHDTAGVAAILAPDVVVVSSNSTHIVGREANALRFAEQFRLRPDVTYRRAPGSVRIFEPWHMAAEEGTWAGSWTDADGRVSIGGRYFAKWRRIDGAWRVESETYVPSYCRGSAYCRRAPQ